MTRFPIAAALALLLLAGCAAPSAPTGTAPPTAAPGTPRLLGTERFEGSAGGVAGPDPGLPPASPAHCNNLLAARQLAGDSALFVPVERNASWARIELDYDAGPAGNGLRLDVHRTMAVMSGVNYVGRAEGPSPIVFNLTADDLGSASQLNLLVFNCGAPAVQSFTGRVDYYAGPGPE